MIKCHQTQLKARAWQQLAPTKIIKIEDTKKMSRSDPAEGKSLAAVCPPTEQRGEPANAEERIQDLEVMMMMNDDDGEFDDGGGDDDDDDGDNDDDGDDDDDDDDSITGGCWRYERRTSGVDAGDKEFTS